MRKTGIIIILVGIGVLFISIFFSSGFQPNLDLISNISMAKIVILKEKAKVVILKEKEGLIREMLRKAKDEPPKPPKARVAIPLKYALSLSVILILTGTGMVLLSPKRK